MVYIRQGFMDEPPLLLINLTLGNHETVKEWYHKITPDWWVTAFTSAVRYSRMAALYTAAVAPTRPWLVVRVFRCLWIRPTGNYKERHHLLLSNSHNRIDFAKETQNAAAKSLFKKKKNKMCFWHDEHSHKLTVISQNKTNECNIIQLNLDKPALLPKQRLQKC